MKYADMHTVYQHRDVPRYSERPWKCSLLKHYWNKLLSLFQSPKIRVRCYVYINKGTQIAFAGAICSPGDEKKGECIALGRALYCWGVVHNLAYQYPSGFE